MRIAVVPSWYPTEDDPVAGHFFARHAEALAGSEDDHVAVISPPRGTPVPAFCRHVVAEALRVRPDVIHAHVASPAGIAALAARPLVHAPVVLSEHSGPLDRLYGDSRLRRGLVRRVFRSADAVTAPSLGTAEEIAALGVRREIFELFVPVPAYPMPDRRPVGGRVVAVGMMDDASKGFGHLIEAWRRVGHAPAELLIVGDGRHRGALEGRAGESRAGGRIRFLGRRSPEETRRIVGTAEVFVSSSVFESGGYAAVEAAVLGRSLVLTDVGVARRLVDDGRGRLVAPGDARALAAALDAALRDADRVDRAGLRARALSLFGSAAIRAATHRVYRRVVA